MRFSISEILFIGYLGVVICRELKGDLNPEWALSGVALCLFFLNLLRINLHICWLFTGIATLGLIQALYGLGQYAHLFTCYTSNYQMTGCFDNTAGFTAALVISLPFVLFLVSKSGIYWRITGITTLIILISAICLSYSRTGIMATLVIVGFWCFKVYNLEWLHQLHRGVKNLLIIIVVSSILACLYLWKKDSADGRLLIWQCTAKMIADKPLLGHGAGSFQREYMVYQADYFKNHPDSRYVKLADNVKHPFNEFYKLFVEQGLVGIVFMWVFIYLLIREYRRNRSLEIYYSGLCIVGIAAFACFSYPLTYPFIRLMLIFSIAVIMKDEGKALEIPRRVFSLLKPALLIACTALLALSCKMFYDEYTWCAIAHRSLAGETIKVMPDYERLYKTMNRNAFFLYNYGAELNFIGETQKSNLILNETSRLYNDIDLQLLLADNYQKMNQNKEAENCLLLASNMIPNRFIPLYQLAQLYKKMGANEKALEIAKAIINKPVKIMSPEILSIKSEMEKELKK